MKGSLLSVQFDCDSRSAAGRSCGCFRMKGARSASPSGCMCDVNSFSTAAGRLPLPPSLPPLVSTRELLFSLVFSICFHSLSIITCFPLQTQLSPLDISKRLNAAISPSQTAAFPQVAAAAAAATAAATAELVGQEAEIIARISNWTRTHGDQIIAISA